jgi:steroid delta-isomerase-like uncharacterized protein
MMVHLKQALGVTVVSSLKIIIMKTENVSKANEKELHTKQNKDLIRRTVEEIWNQGNYSALERFVSRDFIVRLPDNETIQGVEGIKQFFSQLRNAFPDIRFVIDDQVAEADRVVTHWTAKGTHQGTFKGIPPSGKRLNFTAIDINRIVNEKIVECWSKVDELGILKQLGAIPVVE